MTTRQWTVGELIAHLQTMPLDLPVHLDDADTHWTIDKFDVLLVLSEELGSIPCCLLYPCDYSEMLT